jgi:selenocysteine lyase/cysteine desulfurase
MSPSSMYTQLLPPALADCLCATRTSVHPGSLERARLWPDRPDGLVYLDHALRGPLPAPTRQSMLEALELCSQGRLGVQPLRLRVEAARSTLACLLGWPPDCVAFVGGNTTGAVATLAQAIRWRAGDIVLTQADEFPGNVLPWRSLESRGVRLEVLPSRAGRLVLDDLTRALEAGAGRVRVVALAGVTLSTGERRDLRAIGAVVRSHRALLSVDAAQCLGVLGMDLSHVDAVQGCGRKWLLGPPGVGILALRPGLAAELDVPTGGLGSVGGEGRWRPEARRLEGGALPEVALAGLATSLELLGSLGATPEQSWLEVEARVLALARLAAELAGSCGCRVLSPEDSGRSGVVHLELPRPIGDLERRLETEGVVLRQVAPARVRLSPHAWTTARDLEQATARLEAALSG